MSKIKRHIHKKIPVAEKLEVFYSDGCPWTVVEKLCDPMTGKPPKLADYKQVFISDKNKTK